MEWEKSEEDLERRNRELQDEVQALKDRVRTDEWTIFGLLTRMGEVEAKVSLLQDRMVGAGPIPSDEDSVEKDRTVGSSTPAAPDDDVSLEGDLGERVQEILNGLFQSWAHVEGENDQSREGTPGMPYGPEF